MEGKNSAYTKLYNRRRLLWLLRQHPLSRAELARRMGLTRAAISLITDELIKEGVIRESSQQPDETGPGRTPTLLTLCSGVYYALGVSLRRSGCRVGLLDITGKLLCQREVLLDHSASQDCRLDRIGEQLLDMMTASHVKREQVLGIGIASPGPLDSAAGVILDPPNFPQWENCGVCAALSERLDLPAYLENDASAAALYNYMDRDFPEKEDFLLLYVDCGVGSGVISGGKLLRSLGGFTCELGHTSIDFRGPLCSCGNRGCLEMYASLDKVTEQFPGVGSWDELMASEFCQEALDLEAEYLAAAIVNFANVIGISAVLLGGRLQRQSEKLLPLLRRKIAGRMISHTIPVFMPSLYNEETYVRSACCTVFGRFLGEDQ